MDHARQAFQVLHHRGGHRLLKVHHHIAALGLAKLDVHDVRNRIQPEGARNLQGDSQCNARDREHRAPGAALEIAHHHEGAGTEVLAKSQPLDQCLSVRGG